MGKIVLIQDILEDKISLDEARRIAIMHQGQIFRYFDEGCTRFVFVNEDEDKVIKIDKDRRSNDWNELEGKIYENASQEAKDQMVPTRMIDGLIEQDFVTPIKMGGIKLNIQQRLFANSCRGEVGWTKDGRLLCFDLDEFKKY